MRVQHHIDTGKAQPIRQKPYKMSKAENEFLLKEIQRMLALNIIKPGNCAWTSPWIVVKRTDGSWRMAVDYRCLNNVTKPDLYPIPSIEDIIDNLDGKTI